MKERIIMLALTNVGIQPVYLEDITRDDIELTKNAIKDECKPIMISALFKNYLATAT